MIWLHAVTSFMGFYSLMGLGRVLFYQIILCEPIHSNSFSSRTAVFAVNLFYTDHCSVLPASSILLIKHYTVFQIFCTNRTMVVRI